METPAFSECVVWTLVRFAESLKRCDLYVILAAIFQQCTQPIQAENARMSCFQVKNRALEDSVWISLTV